MTYIKSLSGATNSISQLPNAYYLPSGYDFNLLSSRTEDTIVVSKYHNLNGATVSFGSNKKIYFQGGTMSNGTLSGTNCQIIADKVHIFPDSTISFSGSWKNDIYPEWWANSTTASDWQVPLQKALDTARLSSGKIILSAYRYQYYNQLTVYEGTTILGVSRGDTVFGAGPIKGSVLHCLGNSNGSTVYGNIALKIVGRMVTLRDFTIKGERSVNKYGDGIVIYGIGDGSSSQSLIEGLFFENIVIHGFERGKGLNLLAGNAGAVTYSDFFNIRIRDCADHLKIECLSSDPIFGHTGSTGLTYSSSTGFINSNNFNGLYLSGYCETGIHVYTEPDKDLVHSQQVYRPANNLIFNAVIIEPPYSINSHIRIEGGGSSVRMRDIRIEASQQDSHYPAVPVVYLGEGTNSNLIDCDQMSVPIVDLGWNNRISGHNMKNALPNPDSDNLYKNSAFVGLDKTGSTVFLPEWQIEEQYIGTNSYAWRDLSMTSSISINYISDEIEYGYKTLQVSVPPDYQFRLYQDIDRTLHRLPNAKVNVMVNTINSKDVIWTYQDSVTPILSGGPCYGGNVWEPLGAFFNITSATLSTYYRIPIFCQNYTADTMTFSVTMPSFVTGEKTPLLPAKPMTENGGTFYGPVANNVVRNILPISNPAHSGSSTADIILPLEGNYFIINEAGVTVQKINATVNRFGRGTVITLYFNYADQTVIDSAYINLTKPYISSVGSTLTLQTFEGNGLWSEIGRTEKKESGYISLTASSVMSGNFMVLNQEYNQFGLIGFTQSTNIQRINYTSRFPEGRQIHLSFTTPNSLVQISNSGYITLGMTGPYIPVDNDWIKLETIGNGTWYEVARKPKNVYPAYNGYATLDTVNTVSTNYLSLPLTGEDYFKITNGATTSTTITRINYDSNIRFTAGSEVILTFGTSSVNTLTPNITLSNSAYLTFRYGTAFTPVAGDWIKLLTIGDGLWLETDRKKSDYKYLTIGYTQSDVTTAVSTNFLTLPTTGENYFSVNNTGTQSSTITRINSVDKFNAGKEITLYFETLTSGISISHSTYISLAYSVAYAPNAGDWVKFVTKGDGTWVETGRKVNALTPPDLSLTLSATYLASTFLTLPLTGENYFKLSAATLGGSIARINNTAGTRFPGGKIIMLEFTSVAQPVTLVHSGYIALSGSASYVPSVNGGVVLFTRGDGTWRELSRF